MYRYYIRHCLQKRYCQNPFCYYIQKTNLPTYEQLLDAFWAIHDPTTTNRQGPDVGSQYRSAIFFHDAGQEAAARASKERLEAAGQWRDPIVTEIVPAGTFTRAEDYHQQYLDKRTQRFGGLF